MAKMTIIYKTPKDTAAFDRHYLEVHVPLAKQLPGLKQYEISTGAIASPTGHNSTYLVASLSFDSMDAIRQAFASDIGKQCALDRKILAPENDDVQIYVHDTAVV